MSVVAIFKLADCCGRLMVFGRFKGYEESQWKMRCPNCGGQTKLRFQRYAEEESVGVKLKGKWDDLQFLLPVGELSK